MLPKLTQFLTFFFSFLFLINLFFPWIFKAKQKGSTFWQEPYFSIKSCRYQKFYFHTNTKHILWLDINFF